MNSLSEFSYRVHFIPRKGNITHSLINLLCSSFHIFCLKSFESGNIDVRNQSVQFVGRIFVLIAHTGQSNTNSEGDTPVNTMFSISHFRVYLARIFSPKQAMYAKYFDLTIYTRSSDSAPSISALLGLVLIEKLTKSSISTLF